MQKGNHNPKVVWFPSWTVKGATSEARVAVVERVLEMVVDWLPGSTVHMMDTAFRVSLLASYHSSPVCGLVGKPEVSRNPICRCYPLLFCCCCCCWKMGLPPFPWTLPICVAWLAREPHRNACLYCLPLVVLRGFWGLEWGLHAQTTIAFWPHCLLSPYHIF